MQELIDFLRGCPEGFDLASGLCTNAYEVTTSDEQCEIFDAAMYTVAKTWEHYSGNPVYPITNSIADHYKARDDYRIASKHEAMYKGEYGRRRIELANLIADELEKQLCKS